MDLRELPKNEFIRHPWEVARADFFTKLLSGELRTRRAQRVLDVGAGDGYVATRLLELLPEGSEILCIDVNYQDSDLERLVASAPRGLSFHRSVPEGPVDWLLMLDVLEHVEDDVGLLRQLVRSALQPDGRVILSVPAWPSLYVEHDAALGHFRRYRPEALAATMAAAGLHIEQAGSLFTSLLVPRALAKLTEMARGIEWKPGENVLDSSAPTGAGDWRAGPLLTRLTKAALTLDHSALRLMCRAGVKIPGLSAWALGSIEGCKA